MWTWTETETVQGMVSFLTEPNINRHTLLHRVVAIITKIQSKTNTVGKEFLRQVPARASAAGAPKRKAERLTHQAALLSHSL